MPTINLLSRSWDALNNFLHCRREANQALHIATTQTMSEAANKKLKKLDIAVLSDGFGHTVPHAIRKIENAAQNKVQLIDYHAPRDINSLALNREVDNVFNYIEENKLVNADKSRAAVFIELVKSKKIDAPISLSIIEKTAQAAAKLDCIFLPGGENIPIEWYRKNVETNIFPSHHYRTIVELTLIHEAREKGIPLMGVCRGHQIIHVYHGKTLENNLFGFHGVQTFKLIDKNQKGLLAALFRETVRGKVMHCQGVSLAEGQNGTGDLEPLTTADGLVKAAESKYGAAAPVLATQFHPEMYDSMYNYERLSKNNEVFFRIFHESALVRNWKRTSITQDVLIVAQKNLKGTFVSLHSSKTGA